MGKISWEPPMREYESCIPRENESISYISQLLFGIYPASQMTFAQLESRIPSLAKIAKNFPYHPYHKHLCHFNVLFYVLLHKECLLL